MAFLKVLAAPARGQIYPIGPRNVVILGRGSTCDIILNKQSLSRHHAQIVADEQGFSIEDYGSTNGTFVNGHRVEHRMPLADGDRILLHDLPLAFYLDGHLEDLKEPGTAEFLPLALETDDQVDDEETEEADDCLTSHEIPQTPPAADRLETLMAIARHLGSSLNIESILPRTLDLLFHIFPNLIVGEIHITNAQNELVPVAMKHGRESDSRDLTIKSSGEELIHKVFETNQSRIEHSELTDVDSVLEDQFLSTLCTPIIGAGEQLLGVIMVQSEDSSRPFDEEDLELISTVAVLTAQALGYSRAHQMAVRLEKTERELETARAIQLATLPSFRPEVPGYQFFDHYAAAGQVGGDCFFYESLSDGRVIFGLADASGKGLSAAMHIMRFVGEVRLRLATARTFKSALAQINQFTCNCSAAGFVTACVCILDPRKHTLAIGNAGHMSPLRLRIRSSRVEELVVPNGSLPFGVRPENEFHPFIFSIAPGDKIYLYTDGISEAMNASSRIYGIDRLKGIIMTCQGTLEQDIARIVDDINSFRAGAAVSDDLCIVALQREDT